jgi:MFS family permease
MTISPFAAWLISQSGWRSAQLTIGLAALFVMVAASLLVRRAPAVNAGAPAAAKTGAAMTVPQALRTAQFAVLALTYFLCCSAHSGPIFHTVSYAMFCGIPALGAVTIYSAEGFAGLFGRVLLGLGADRFGARNVLVAGLLVQAVAAAAYATVHSIEGFYAVALVFGFAYGGVMPIYAVIARQYFPPAILGAVFGAIAMTSSIGMAAGPLLGGWVFDTFHGYTWLYVASAALGAGAMMSSLFLPLRAAAPRLEGAAVAA